MKALSQDAYGLSLGKMASFTAVRVATPSLEIATHSTTQSNQLKPLHIQQPVLATQEPPPFPQTPSFQL